MSKEAALVVKEEALPELYSAVEVTDIQLPSFRLVYAMSEFAKKGLAKEGDVVLSFGNDDPDPRFLIGDGSTSFEAYIIGRDKTAALTIDGSIEWQKERDYNDPNSQDVWFFYMALPDYEPLIPVRWMGWKAAGAPCARQLNTMILKAKALGESDIICVKFQVGEKKSRDGRYTYKILQASNGTPTPEGMKIARDLAIKLHAANAKYNRTDPVPSDQPEF